MTDKTPTRLMFAGTCTLQGGKTGELWITEELARQHPENVTALRKAASPFGKERRGFTVGAVYEVPAVVGEDGRVTNITRDFRYVDMVDTVATASLQLEKRGLDAIDAAKKAEEKARKNPAYASLIRDLARIVAAAPFDRQDRVIAGIGLELRRTALDLWKQGQGRR
jgi:hypothetical protein